MNGSEKLPYEVTRKRKGCANFPAQKIVAAIEVLTAAGIHLKTLPHVYSNQLLMILYDCFSEIYLAEANTSMQQVLGKTI